MNSTCALPSGNYRAASLKQVWLCRLNAAAASVSSALEAFGRGRAASHLQITAAQVQASRPELATELRRAAAALASTR